MWQHIEAPRGEFSLPIGLLDSNVLNRNESKSLSWEGIGCALHSNLTQLSYAFVKKASDMIS